MATNPEEERTIGSIRVLIKYRVSHYIGNSKFGIKILFDGRGYGGKIFRTVSYVY